MNTSITLLDHHQATIDRLVAAMQVDPAVLAVIIGGSVTKGLALPSSDIDTLLLVTDAAFERRAATADFQFFSRELAGYPDGYVDGKYINLQFLHDVAARGTETARSAFLGAFVAWSRIPDLAALIAQIPVYPEDQQQERIRSFVTQLQALQWFATEAEKRANLYLMHWTATRMVLFGSRLILAHNKILFPFHKWMMAFVERAPDKPGNFVQLANELLRAPGVATANAFADTVLAFRDWPQPPHGWPSRFMEDTELNWLRDRLPPEDW